MISFNSMDNYFIGTRYHEALAAYPSSLSWTKGTISWRASVIGRLIELRHTSSMVPFLTKSAIFRGYGA
ncbi:hypothetical protein CDL12_23621 [Handroanthus impetiginosus]|uniref:Uncharacterized protein n=1 Tax=Handroanthus impetiginosus TaxID=429701 RepID=A0A2G9GEY4_9LAMI|nr:hypothetical protein CDL12_23621 [Handroanthus impetiginosus]